MSLRFAFLAGVAVVALLTMLAAPERSFAQTSPPPAAAKPETNPPPAQISPEVTTRPDDIFGADVTLTAKPMLYIKGSGKWDSAFQSISAAVKKLEAYAAKEGLKTDGLPMTIFTATDDSGFDFQAALRLAEAPKNPPRGEIALGQSPEGHALKFVHRGAYGALDDTYEAITNDLDEKRVEAKDLIIEEYVTDPASADPNKLVVNIYIMTK